MINVLKDLENVFSDLESNDGEVVLDYDIIEEVQYLLKSVSQDDCELEGPYECSMCAGHMMLDATYLDQVGTTLTCPYCNNLLAAEEID